ncbi:hypothetical protein [Arenimonas alkanexedens]
MSDTYTKLFRSIAASTIVSEPLATRWLWVTLLSQCDKAGNVYGSIPGLARLANITITEVEKGLESMMSPDPYSRTKENEGRRIAEIDGGWVLLNHAKYDAMRNESERADYKREWDRKHRSKSARAERDSAETSGQSDANPTDSDKSAAPDPTSTNTNTNTKEQKPESSAPASPSLAGLACRAMRDAGCGQTNPSHPDLQAALAEGVTPEALADTAREAIAAGVRKPFAYAIQTARGRHADGARPAPGANHVQTRERGGSRRLSAVEQVEHAIAERREREARTIEGESVSLDA